MNFVKSLILKMLAFVLFVIVLVAASYNSDKVSLVFMEWRTPEWAVSIWIIAAFVLGIGVAMLYNLWANTQLRLAARKANKTVNRAQQDIDKLKAASSTEISTTIVTE